MPNTEQSIFVNTRTMKALLGVSESTLKFWRLGYNGRPPKLIEGVHWVKAGERNTLFHKALMMDYLANLANPERHQRAIDAYLASLASSKAVA